jgi:hypothetical protein
MVAPRDQGGRQAPSSSLDLIRDPEGEPRGRTLQLEDPWQAPETVPTRCERVHFDLLNLNTGELVSGRCNTYHCPYCGPRKTRQYQQAAAWVRPERMVGLSELPEGFAQARKQLNDLATRLRRRGYEWEWFWAIEANPAGTGYHLHAVQKGSYVPQARLQEMCGNRIPHIQAIRRGESGQAAAYLAKGATSYLTKGGLHGLDGYYQHLLLNGGVGAHWSRGYFGQPITQVVKAMGAERHGQNNDTWVRFARDRRPGSS